MGALNLTPISRIRTSMYTWNDDKSQIMQALKMHLSEFSLFHSHRGSSKANASWSFFVDARIRHEKESVGAISRLAGWEVGIRWQGNLKIARAFNQTLYVFRLCTAAGSWLAYYRTTAPSRVKGVTGHYSSSRATLTPGLVRLLPPKFQQRFNCNEA